MAEERNLATVSATDTPDEDSTKRELQRRMEEARESITQTVSEIKETVTNQYNSVKESVSEALDWREQYRKRPVAWSVGAASVGLIAGYAVAGAVKGDSRDYDDEEDRDETYPSYEETDVFSRTGATPARYPSYEGARAASAQRSRATATPAPAAQAITGGAYGSSAYAPSSARAESVEASSATDYADTQSSGEEEESDKPGLLARFKETRAYDRLEAEVGNLGDRLIEELSSVGQNVVLPALFSKIKDMFGVDLSNKQQGARGGAGSGGSSSSSRASGTTSAPSVSGAQASAASAGSGGSSYGTSENIAYGGSTGAGSGTSNNPGGSGTGSGQQS